MKLVRAVQLSRSLDVTLPFPWNLIESKKFSVICVRFLYKYFFPFFIQRRLSFLKTFLVYYMMIHTLVYSECLLCLIVMRV